MATRRKKVLTVNKGDKIRVLTEEYDGYPEKGEIGTIIKVHDAEDNDEIDQYGGHETSVVDIEFPSGDQHCWTLYANEFELIEKKQRIAKKDLANADRLADTSIKELKDFMGL